MMVRKLALAGSCALAAASLAPANAAVVFTLQGVVFADGATANGTFTLDDTLTTVLGFSITTGAGRFYAASDPANAPGAAVPGDTYAPATATAILQANGIDFDDDNQFAVTRTLSLDFGGPVATGTHALVGLSGEFAGFGGRLVTSGQVTSAADAGPGVAAVPEPAAWMTMLAGFAAIGATMRRRRTVVRFA